MSRAVAGTAVFEKPPSSAQIQSALDRAVRSSGTAPRYVVTDKGKQFWCRSFKRWCKRRGIRPRYGAIGQPASIVLVERFTRSMKQEALRQVLVPTSVSAMRREVTLYGRWYNAHRPHMALAGKTPNEVFERRRRAQRRFEPRPKWPHRPRQCCAGGDRLQLALSFVEGRRHLPVIELKRAA